MLPRAQPPDGRGPPRDARDHGPVASGGEPVGGIPPARDQHLVRCLPNIVAPLDNGALPWMCMWPVDARTTELELQWFAPDWGDGDTPEENTLRMTLFETVMAQDTANMAAIQHSVEWRGAQPFQIGWHERLIHHFHRAIDLAIGESEIPEGPRSPQRSTPTSRTPDTKVPRRPFCVARR
ncbi:MAG: RHO alpha subunit C-terminal catalytic domain-containing protein [Microthrixaceae bacterium]